jgi:hypothetical protein
MQNINSQLLESLTVAAWVAQVFEEPWAGHEVSTTFEQSALPTFAHPWEHLLRP